MAMWVLATKVEHEIGLTPNQLRGLVDRGSFVKGIHYAVIDRKRFYNLGEIQSWLNTKASGQKAAALKSGGVLKANGTQSTSTKPPTKQISRMQLAIVKDASSSAREVNTGRR